MQWRCFLCDRVFLDRQSAAEHFGVTEAGWETACSHTGLSERGIDLRRMLIDVYQRLKTFRRTTFPISKAEHDVLVERRRQTTAEGYTEGHDDGHDAGDLAHAAACYAVGTASLTTARGDPIWPWGRQEWKGKSRRRNLERAAALIIAEIERLDRAAAPPVVVTPEPETV